MDQVDKNETQQDSIVQHMDIAMKKLKIEFTQMEVEYLIRSLLKQQEDTQKYKKEYLAAIHLSKDDEEQYNQLIFDIQNHQDFQKYNQSQLYFIQHSDHMGMNTLDYIFSEGKVQLILGIVQHLNLHTNYFRLNQFAKSITKYFKCKLTQISTFPLIPFLKQARKIPIFTFILISILINQDLFNNLILYFNIDNRCQEGNPQEHNQILKLIIKIIQEYKDCSTIDQFNILKEMHFKSNQSLYFDFINKPKNVQKKINNLVFGNNFTNVHDIMEFHEIKKTTNLKIKIIPYHFWKTKKYNTYTRTIQLTKVSKKKKKIQNQLQNNTVFWSILFECIRQENWTNFFDYYNQSEDLRQYQDQQGRSALAYCIKSAPKDVFPKVLQLINSKNIEAIILRNGTNIIHLILLNKKISIHDKLEFLSTIKQNIGQHSFEQLLKSPITNQGITPLVLFLDSWQNYYCDHLNEFLSIMKLLSEPFLDCQFNTNQFRAMQLITNWSTKKKINLQYQFDFKGYYLNHSQVAKALCKLPSPLFQIAVKHCKWIDWLGLYCQGDTLLPNSNQFAINTLIRTGRLELVSQILQDIENRLASNLPQYFQGITFLESNPFQFTENDVYFYKMKYGIKQLLQELSEFYHHYPFDILLGMYAEAQPQQQQQIYGILKHLVTKEPRVLCTSISVYKKQKIMKMLYQNKLMDLYYSQSQEIQQLYFEPTDALCKTLTYKSFSALEILLIKYEAARQGKYKQGKDKRIYCKQRLMMDKLFIDFFQLIYDQQQLQLIIDILPRIAGYKLLMRFIGGFILRKLPDTGGVDLSTFFSILKQYPQLIVSISGAFNKALIAKNTKLLNYFTVLIQNPMLKLNLNCFNTSSYFRNITNYHYSVCFSTQQFQQLLIDTNLILAQEDYICMAYALCRNGMVEKFKLISHHIPNKDIQCMCLREALIQFGKQEIQIKFKNHQSYHNQEAYKRKYLPEALSRFDILHKISPSPQQYDQKQEILVIQDDKTSQDKQLICGSKTQYGQPKSDLQQCKIHDLKMREKEIAKQQIFLKDNANAYSIYSQLEFEPKNYQSLIKILISQLLSQQQQLKEYHYLLKKIYLIPFLSEDITIMLSIENVLKFIYKSIDLLTSYLLSNRFKNTIQDNQIANRGIKFIQSNLQRKLIHQIYQNPARFKRIIINIGKTNLRNPQQVDFALKIAQTILHNFHQHDFDDIVGQNLFNALATFLIQCQCKNQQALNAAALILNKREFYQIYISTIQNKKKKNEKIKLIEQQFPIIVNTIQNEEYLLYLQKFKIMPFHDSITLKTSLNQFFEQSAQIKQVSLYEYLCLKKCELLIKMDYIPHQYHQGLFSYYLFIACKSGSLAIFENIIYHILKIKYDQVFELCLKYPILKSIVLYFNDTAAQQIISNIFHNRVNKEIHNHLNIDFLIEIVNKRYGEVYKEILNIYKTISDNEQEYLAHLKQMFLLSIPRAEQYFVGMEEEIEEEQIILSMNLMEYSVFMGFPDLALSAKNVFQEESPLGPQFIRIINSTIYNVGVHFLRTEKYHNLEIYQLFLELKSYYQINTIGRYRVNAQEQSKSDIEIITSLVLFWVLVEPEDEYIKQIFKKLPCYIFRLKSPIGNRFPFITELLNEQKSKSVYDYLYQLHISGIQFKFKNDAMNVIEFLKQYDSQNNHLVFYLNHNIQKLYLKLFDVDILSQRNTIVDDLSMFSELSISKKPKIQKVIKCLDDYNSEDELNQEENLDENLIKMAKSFHKIFGSLQNLIQQYFIINLPEIVLNYEMEPFHLTTIETRKSMLFFIESVMKNNKSELLVEYLSMWDSQMSKDTEEICAFTVHYYLLKIFLCVCYPAYQTNQQCDKSSEFAIFNLLSDLLFQIKFDGLRQSVWKTISDFDSIQEQFKELQGNILEDRMFINGLIEFFNRSTNHQELKLNIQYHHLKYFFKCQVQQESNKIYNGFLLIRLICNLIRYEEMFIEIIDQFSDVELIIDFKITNQQQQQEYLQITSIDVSELNDHQLYQFKIQIPLIHYQQSEDQPFQVMVPQQSYDSLKLQLNEYFFKRIEINKIYQQIIIQDGVQLCKKSKSQALKNSYQIHESEVISLTINKDEILLENSEIILQSSQELFNFALAFRTYHKTIKEFKKDIKQFKIDAEQMDAQYLPVFPDSALTILEQLDTYQFLTQEFKIQVNVEILSYINYLEVNRRDRQIEKLLDILDSFKKQQSELIEIHWPIYIKPNCVVEDQYNYPKYLYYLMCSQIHSHYNAKLLINYYSYIKTLMLPFFRHLRPKYDADLEGMIFFALEWPLLDYIITEITLAFDNSYLKRRLYMEPIFQLRSIEEDQIIQYNNQSLPGVQNQLFRFGKTEYYLNADYLLVVITINSTLAYESVYSGIEISKEQKNENKNEFDLEFVKEILNLKDLNRYQSKVELPSFMKEQKYNKQKKKQQEEEEEEEHEYLFDDEDFQFEGERLARMIIAAKKKKIIRRLERQRYVGRQRRRGLFD